MKEETEFPIYCAAGSTVIKRSFEEIKQKVPKPQIRKKEVLDSLSECVDQLLRIEERDEGINACIRSARKILAKFSSPY